MGFKEQRSLVRGKEWVPPPHQMLALFGVVVPQCLHQGETGFSHGLRRFSFPWGRSQRIKGFLPSKSTWAALVLGGDPWGNMEPEHASGITSSCHLSEVERK